MAVDTINIFAIQALHGLVYGMVLFLVASGLTLIFGMIGVLNFAHGALYMLGAYFSYTIIRITGHFWLSLLIAPLLVGCVGVFIERVFLRKVHSYGHAHELLLTFGLAYIIEELVKMIWGNEPLYVEIPKLLTESIRLMDVTYPTYRLFILLISLAVFFFLFLIFFRTRVGMIVTAAVSRIEMVNALGVNVPLLYTALFGVGGALAGIAGVIAGPYMITNPGMAANIIIDLFVVVVVGGLGSIPGALLASLLVGELQSFGILFLSKVAVVFQFVLLAVVLIVKPEGLFGEKD
jgi:branched-chain amino acid transport system permease protein